jgi:hypothetical protein
MIKKVKGMITWVLENDVFKRADPLREGAQRHGHKIVNWSDDWWLEPKLPKMAVPTIFHGSLGNAHEIAQSGRWRPGAFCLTPHFFCSHWYANAGPWLVHRQWRKLKAIDFVNQYEQILDEMASSDRIFVRPDSPLKPFSGRVLQRENISLKAMDFGFYFDDENLPVIVAPIQEIGREWRFVVVANRIVTGSEYQAEGRQAIAAKPPESVWAVAEDIASNLPAPQDVYVLDLCECDQGIRLMELNPFSGADLYACDGPVIVDAISKLLR